MVQWFDTQFKQFLSVSVSEAVKGIKNYAKIQEGRTVTWRSLQKPNDKEMDCFEQFTQTNLEYEEYIPATQPVSSLQDVEDLKNMRFEPNGTMNAPDLFEQEKTVLKDPEQFRGSPLQAFFQYLPLSFWREVLTHTNNKRSHSITEFSLDELFRFIGIMMYMSVVDKGKIKAVDKSLKQMLNAHTGETRNYFRRSPNDQIFNGVPGYLGDFGCDRVMSERRFWQVRSALTFNTAVTAKDLAEDPLARIRPLINMFKVTCGQYVEAGRDLSLDESSVACRSRYGRHVIVYNPMKPTGTILVYSSGFRTDFV